MLLLDVRPVDSQRENGDTDDEWTGAVRHCGDLYGSATCGCSFAWTERRERRLREGGLPRFLKSGLEVIRIDAFLLHSHNNPIYKSEGVECLVAMAVI